MFTKVINAQERMEAGRKLETLSVRLSKATTVTEAAAMADEATAQLAAVRNRAILQRMAANADYAAGLMREAARTKATK